MLRYLCILGLVLVHRLTNKRREPRDPVARKLLEPIRDNRANLGRILALLVVQPRTDLERLSRLHFAEKRSADANIATVALVVSSHDRFGVVEGLLS